MTRTWSIRHSLVGLVVAATLPLAGLVAYGVVCRYQSDTREAHDTARRHARVVAKQIGADIELAHGLLERLARRPHVRALDPAECDSLLADLRGVDPRFSNLATVTRTGRVVCSALPPLQEGAVDLSDTEWFQSFSRAPGFFVGQPFVGRFTNRWVSTVALPLHDDSGALAGLVYQTFDLERMGQRLWTDELPDGGRILVLDTRARVVARSDEDLPGLAQELAGVEIAEAARRDEAADVELRSASLDGEDRIFGFARVPYADWSVCVGLPAARALAPARAHARTAGLLAFVFVALAGLLAWAVGRRIGLPIRRLARTADEIRHGAVDTRAPVDGPDEVARVAQELNAMLDVRAAADDALRRSEERLRELNAELEERVAERTRELAEANANLSTFNRSVGHDLRAPMRAIQGYCQALVEDHAAELSPAAREMIERLDFAARRLADMTEGLLQLAQFSRGELRRESLDLSKLAADVAREIHAVDPARAVEWIVPPGLRAYGDERLLRIALFNLFDNAFKFTRDRRPAHIEIGRARAEDGGEFFVRDDGIGFEARDAASLFVPFQRLHARDGFAGQGLGLATVDAIARRHGGSVRAEGRPGAGTTIWIRLPDEPRAALERVRTRDATRTARAG
jgi:signal transduction histidine kinase